MVTPAHAIDHSRPLYLRTLADLNDERLQLKIDLAALRLRESELKQEKARLRELLDSTQAARNSLQARPSPLVTIRSAGDVSATTADALKSKLKTENDPRERFRIQKRIDALNG